MAANNQFTGHRRFSIAQKVTLTISTLLVVTLGILWLLLSQNLDQLLHRQTQVFGVALAKQIANSAAELVLADDKLGLQVMLKNVVENKNILNVSVYNTHAKLLAKAASASLNEATSTSLYTAPVTFQQVTAGQVRVLLDNTFIEQAIYQSIRLMTLATLVMLLLSILASFALGRNLVRPLKHLILASRAIQQGEFNYRIAERRSDEIGQLIGAFNDMAQGLEDKARLKQTFYSVVDPDIADAILANSTLSQVTNDYVEATVLFIDIVGFTGLCEELAPKQIVSLLNQYYFYINEVAKRCRGSVDKFVGDGAMVLFGAPQPNEQHAYDAVRAGLLFLALFADLAKTQNKQVMPVKVHLGVHTGRMLAGILGSKERMHYTLVGDNVNLGARLCEMADPEQLVISDAVLKHSSVVNKLSVSTTGSKKLKGKSTNVSTYQVAGLVESQEQQWITNQCQQLVNIEV